VPGAVFVDMALDVDALETSFDLVAPRGDELTQVFYSRLFAAAPDVAPLFARTDMEEQRAKLLATLVVLRKSLRDLDGLGPKLRELGSRHARYGARPAHYPIVAATLIGAMAEVAGDEWQPEYDRAWVNALTVVADAMLTGSGSSPTGPAGAGGPSPAAT
jgi:hemoglobin-like flavoprotein